ncbi:unnamed protein product [Phytomonas sp. Hart1]|nr:unnamed protein product [Phytomonas sp. Hart1]|eukprot:CCW72102.1 unnamed protein product [Phytomonas sp. isolate Hart1]
MRRLQTYYSLEPAGSHGVWGLDDYHHIPYIFGAAQLVRAEAAPTPILPADVCRKEKVKAYEGQYLYFSMVMWILQNKSGPFSEHSNMLYNISAVESWTKVYNGMIKMYAAEVLAKFNVTQHLLFGPHLPWNTKTLDETSSAEDR